MIDAGIITAQVAGALVAACRINDVEPLGVFENGERGGMTRVLAAATCVDRLGWHPHFAARAFRINRKRLTPSGRRIARVRDQDIDAVEAAVAPANPVRPVSARIIELARPQVERGADVAFVASCYDVDARDLAHALGQEGVAA
jgi:hypothetical protein